MKVRDLMTTNVKWANQDQSIEEVARLLSTSDIGSVPVCQGEQVLGIITDRDIIVRAIAQGKDPKTTKCSEIMSKNIKTVTGDTDVHQASDLMAEIQIR